MRICVIIPAAGRSTRFGDGRDKLDADLGGKPVLHRAIDLFAKREEVCAIVVAGPFDEGAYGEFRDRHGDKIGLLGAKLCRGGQTHRYETVKAALAAVPDEATHVAVHDAARPCAPKEMVNRVFDAAGGRPAVIPGVEVGDTLKRVGAEQAIGGEIDPVAAALLGDAAGGARGRIVEKTVSRENLVVVQTPQIFQKDLLLRAYTQDDLSSTDDAQLVERLGEDVVVVPGDVSNIKITRPDDVGLAMRILGLRPAKGREAHKRF